MDTPMLELGVKFLISYFIGSLMGAMIVGKLRGGVDIRTMGSGNAGGTNALRTQGLRRRVVLRVPNFTLLPSLLPSRDILFTVPQRIVTTFPRSPRLEARKPPVGLDDAAFYLYWHARNHHNPAHAWLRQQLFEVSAGLDAPDH